MGRSAGKSAGQMLLLRCRAPRSLNLSQSFHLPGVDPSRRRWGDATHPDTQTERRRCCSSLRHAMYLAGSALLCSALLYSTLLCPNSRYLGTSGPAPPPPPPPLPPSLLLRQSHVRFSVCLSVCPFWYGALRPLVPWSPTQSLSPHLPPVTYPHVQSSSERGEGCSRTGQDRTGQDRGTGNCRYGSGGIKGTSA
ncbi:hypothetical protein IWX90DRAFT_231746 [Phyllosticta citrichinensis]|uniref:Uncharacterized protein n=1 Tax=Phyllosticta citrichinensis TaxID=1130410 RepID=A0ABR1XV88_9PEZI